MTGRECIESGKSIEDKREEDFFTSELLTGENQHDDFENEEEEMHRMEAEWDREQTIRDEENKWYTRMQMEYREEKVEEQDYNNIPDELNHLRQDHPNNG